MSSRQDISCFVKSNQIVFEWFNGDHYFHCYKEEESCFGLEPDAMTLFQLDDEPVQIATYQSERMVKKLEGIQTS